MSYLNSRSISVSRAIYATEEGHGFRDRPASSGAQGPVLSAPPRLRRLVAGMVTSGGTFKNAPGGTWPGGILQPFTEGRQRRMAGSSTDVAFSIDTSHKGTGRAPICSVNPRQSTHDYLNQVPTYESLLL